MNIRGAAASGTDITGPVIAPFLIEVLERRGGATRGELVDAVRSEWAAAGGKAVGAKALKAEVERALVSLRDQGRVEMPNNTYRLSDRGRNRTRLLGAVLAAAVTTVAGGVIQQLQASWGWVAILLASSVLVPLAMWFGLRVPGARSHVIKVGYPAVALLYVLLTIAFTLVGDSLSALWKVGLTAPVATAAVAVLILGDMSAARAAVGVAMIGVGVAGIGVGVAGIVGKEVALGVVGIGFGVAAIGIGVSVIVGELEAFADAGIGLGVVGMGGGVVMIMGEEVAVGVVVIGFGVAAIGISVAVIRGGQVAVGVAAISSSVVMIGGGVVAIVGKEVALGVVMISSSVAAIGLGIAVIMGQLVAACVVVIGLGVVMIGGGVAQIVDGQVAGGVAGIGLGVAAIGGGIAFIRSRIAARE